MAEGEAKIRISAVNATKAAFDEIKRSMNDVERAGSTLRAALGAVGVGLSFAGVAAFVKSGIDAADDLNKLSQKVGVSVESLSAFQYAAQLSDVSAEQLSAGLAKLARTADDASSGGKEAARAFEKLGVQFKNNDGSLRGTEELLLDISERFSKLEDGSSKTALAIQLFGRAGAELIPLLNQGRDGFEALRKEAEKLGIVIDRDTARAAEEFNDNLTRLGKQADALKIALAGGLLEPLGKIADAMAKAAREGGILRGIIAGIQTAITGDDAYKFNVEFTKAVDRLFAAEQNVQRLRTLGGAVGGAGRLGLQKALEDLELAKKEVERLQAIKPIIAPEEPPKPASDKRGLGGNSDRAASRAGSAEAERRRLEAEAEKQRKAALDEYLRQSAVYEDRRQEEIAAMAEYYQWLGRENARRVEAADAIRKQLDPTIELAEKTRELAELVQGGFLTQEEGDRALERISSEFLDAKENARGLGEEIQKNNDIARELGLTFTSAFEDAVVSGKKFSEVLQSIGQDIARIVLRKTVTEPAADAISKAVGGFDFSKIFDFGGARAAGGPVSGGKTYLVGENGPELLTMGGSGFVTPNGAGGASLVINMPVNFSANTPAAVRDAVLQMVPTLNRAAVAAVREAGRR